MKLHWTKLHGEHRAGWFDHVATIENCPKLGWFFAVKKDHKVIDAGLTPTLREAKARSEFSFFGGK